jgi:hypothetical protein
MAAPRVLSANGKWCGRAKGRSSKDWITPVRRRAIYLRDGFTCQYCGRDLHGAEPREVTLDHLVAQSHTDKPDHSSSNLITACRKCNCGRADRIWYKFAPAGAVARIQRTRRRKPNLKLARALMNGEVTWGELAPRLKRS